MKNLSKGTRIFLITAYLAGALILLFNFINIKITEPVIFVILCVLGSILHILKVEGATNRSHYTFSFLIFGFAILNLNSQQAIAIILVSNLAEWFWHRPPWFIQLLNISCYIITAQIAFWVYISINPLGITTSWQVIHAIGISMVSFTLVNHLIIGLVLWLARGENFKQSGIFDLDPLFIDFTMLTLGASLKIVWDYNPYALLIFLLPLYPIYISLKIPALERKTETDQKTGLFNHHYFMEQLKNELQRAHRFDRPLSIIMADIDLLRNVNNTYGHLAGDEVLIGVANILKRSVRDYDTVARFGGEEFAILMPETEIEHAIERAEFIRKEIEAASFNIPTSVNPIRATMSLGVSKRDNFGQTGAEIIHNADAALYNSKREGRNLVFAYIQNTFTQILRTTASVDQLGMDSAELQRTDPDDPTVYAASSRSYVPDQAENQESPSMASRRSKTEPENIKPPQASHGPSNKVFLYIALLALISVFSTFAAFRMPLELSPAIDPLQKWIGLALFVLIIVLTEWFSIDLYVKNTSLSTSAVPILASFITFGPTGVLIASLVFAITAALKFRSPFDKFIFNLSNHIIAGLIINLFLSLGRSLSFGFPGSHVYQLIFALVSAIILFIVTTSLISIGIGLDMGQSPIQIWKQQYKWMVLYYIGIGFIAYSLILGYVYEELLGIMVMLVPLMLLRYSQMQYVEHTRDIVSELTRKNHELERSALEINEMNEGLLITLSEIIDLHDPWVLGHSKKVSEYAVSIAESLKLSERQTKLIRNAGLLHDVGKLGMPVEILTKPGKLTKPEYEIIKQHPALGGKLVENSPSLRPLVSIIRHHHESYDGKGYPDRLAGNQISIEARVVAVADAIEAMSSDRPYRQGLKIEKIVEEIKKYSGSQFDPLVVDAAVSMLEHKISEEHPEFAQRQGQITAFETRSQLT
jgi:diguanylate cyclase (GGDEF)-like protein/putative nucleotidyltransferase with HDIG domain